MGLCASSEGSLALSQTASDVSAVSSISSVQLQANSKVATGSVLMASSHSLSAATNMRPSPPSPAAVNIVTVTEPSPSSPAVSAAAFVHGAGVDSVQTPAVSSDQEFKDAQDTTKVPLVIVSASFAVEDVEPLPLPRAHGSNSQECIFFLSHRGPDTKDALVRPLSSILKRLGIPHFFDQDDEAMRLGQENEQSIANALWTCRVGVVFLSDHFAASKWCLKELNTFFLRRRLQSESFLLLPVYYAPHLLESTSTYYPHMGKVSSIIRKHEEAVHEFLVSLIPRLLSIQEVQQVPEVKNAQMQIIRDDFLIKRLWNEYEKSLVSKAERKLFDDPNPGRVDRERIKTVHKSLTPIDIKAGLDVYQPLEYSLLPLSNTEEKDTTGRYSLESIIQDLLNHTPVSLGATIQENTKQGDQIHAKPSVAPAPISRLPSLPQTSNEPLQILLIQGAAGSGKSLFGWHLCSRYYSSANPDRFRAMPILISLPVFRSLLFSGDPTLLLPTYFSDTFGLNDITQLQNWPLVIILDGLDELGSKINLFTKCKLHLWTNSIFLITCRSEFLQESDIAQYITPTNPINNQIAHDRLGKLYLLPFSSKQRAEYIEKFAQRYQSVFGWKAQEYASTLEQLPQLNAFLREPLMLFMVLSVLPQFHLGTSSTPLTVSHARRFDPYFLEVQPANEVQWVFPQIRRAELYALFVTGWADREISRLPPRVEHQKPSLTQVLAFCCQLAFQMFLKTQTSVVTKESGVSEANVSSMSRAQRAKMKQESKHNSSVDEWAVELFAEYQDERACSPLRRSAGGRYSFLHKSMQEYFTALHIASQLTELVLNEEWSSDRESIGKLLISKKRLTTDYAVLRFSSELIDQRSPPKQPYHRALFDILYANCHPLASANAITILNAAGLAFTNLNFQNLDLSSDLNMDSMDVLAADLSAANLFGCNLSHANLSGVRLECASLDSADLRGANLRNTVFGQSSTLKGHAGAVFSLAWSSRANTLFSCSKDSTIRQWSISQDSANLVRVLVGHTSDVNALALSSDEKSLFSGSGDKTIRQWSTEDGSLQRKFTGHTKLVTCLALSSDGKTIFSGSGDSTTLSLSRGGNAPSLDSDDTIRQWSIDTGSLVRVYAGHNVNSLAASSDGEFLFSGSWDRVIRQWMIDTGSLVRVFDHHTSIVSCLACSSDGKILFSGSGDHTVLQWSVDTGSLTHVFDGHTEVVTSLVLSADGKTLFSGAWDKTVRQWSIDTGSLVRVLEVHTGTTGNSVACLALCSDGKSLFSGSYDSSIRQWFVNTGSLVRAFEGHSRYVSSFAFSPDRSLLFSGSYDNTIRAWSINTGSLVRVFEGHTDFVSSLALSLDGNSLLSGSADKTIRQWSIDTGAFICFLKSFPDHVLQLRESESAKVVLTVGQKVDCYDSVNKLCKAVIMDASDTRVLIHYEGWIGWDEWLPRTSARIKPRPSLTIADGSKFSVSGNNIIRSKDSAVIWSSGPWLLGAQDCKLDASTQISDRLRSLLKDYGALDTT